jgi:hypothetical protein
MAGPSPPEISIAVEDADALLDRLTALLENDDRRPGLVDADTGLTSRDLVLTGTVSAGKIVLDLVPANRQPWAGYLSPVFVGQLSEDRRRLEGRFRWGLGLKLLALVWIAWVVLVVPGAVLESFSASGTPLQVAEGVVPPLAGLLAALGLAWLARHQGDWARRELLAALQSAASTRRTRR